MVTATAEELFNKWFGLRNKKTWAEFYAAVVAEPHLLPAMSDAGLAAEVEAAMRRFVRHVLEREPRSLAFLDEVRHRV